MLAGTKSYPGIFDEASFREMLKSCAKVDNSVSYLEKSMTSTSAETYRVITGRNCGNEMFETLLDTKASIQSNIDNVSPPPLTIQFLFEVQLGINVRFRA